MSYGYCVTSAGAALSDKCATLCHPMRITRMAIGTGAHTVITAACDLEKYLVDGRIIDRTRLSTILNLTLEFRNEMYPELNAFQMSEFGVWAQDVHDGEEVLWMYGTFAPINVPKFSYASPGDAYTIKVVATIPAALQVVVAVTPNLLTYDDAIRIRDDLVRQIMMNELTLPLLTDDGQQLLTDTGEPMMAVYHPNQIEVALDAVDDLREETAANLATKATQLSAEISSKSASDRVYTESSVAIAKSEAIADAATKDTALKTELTTSIATAKEQAISTAASDATTKANTAKSQAIEAAATDATTKANAAKTAAIAAAKTETTNQVTVHNNSIAATTHPTFLTT